MVASDIYNQSAFLVLQTAYLYYVDRMSQQEIADQLNVSVTTVSRLLKKAKEEKVINYVMDQECLNCIDLAKELKQEFDLQEVIIAPIDWNKKDTMNPSEKRKLVALEGARYLQRIIQEKDVLGISWGRIVCDMLLYLNPSHKVDTTFVTLHGQLGDCIRQDLRELVTGMAKAFSGKNYYLSSKALVESKEKAAYIKHHPNARKVYEMFDSINISISGIGAWYPEAKSILAENGFLLKTEQEILQNNRVAGDIGLRFFDLDGNECKTELSDRLISIGFEQFKRIERKITVAAGLEKAYALLSALKGELIDVLIVDRELAQELLNMHMNEKEKQNG